MTDTPIYDQLRWEQCTPMGQVATAVQRVAAVYSRAFTQLGRQLGVGGPQPEEPTSLVVHVDDRAWRWQR